MRTQDRWQTTQTPEAWAPQQTGKPTTLIDAPGATLLRFDDAFALADWGAQLTTYKNAQREQWNKDGAAWRRWNPTLDRWYGGATRQMLGLARIQPNQRILDIAAGAGEPAVSAAERVGAGGCVLATDISEGICPTLALMWCCVDWV